MATGTFTYLVQAKSYGNEESSDRTQQRIAGANAQLCEKSSGLGASIGQYRNHGSQVEDLLTHKQWECSSKAGPEKSVACKHTR